MKYIRKRNGQSHDFLLPPHEGDKVEFIVMSLLMSVETIIA